MLNPTLGFVPSEAIPYGRQTLGEEEIQAVIDVLKSPFLTQGPVLEQFEQTFAAFCGVPYAVAFSNGTAALHGACYAAGVGPGDEVITSPLTFVATSNAVLYQQGTPIFADIHPETWNLAIENVIGRLNLKTKALMPVHFAGQPVDLKGIYALADQHGLTVIEDAAHALGARYHGRPIGQCRDMAVFSFHPVKAMTTGEGGMVVTPHRRFYEKLCQFRTHGITKNPAQFQYFSGAPWEYEMQDLGYNYRMTEFQAAMGRVQLSKLEGFIDARRRLATRYQNAFRDIPALRAQQPMENTDSAYHLFPIWLDPAHAPDRQQVFQALVQARIRPQVHYIPVPFQPYYRRQFGFQPGDFPQAERYYQHCLSLPLYPTLTDAEQDYIIDQVLNLLVGA